MEFGCSQERVAVRPLRRQGRVRRRRDLAHRLHLLLFKECGSETRLPRGTYCYVSLSGVLGSGCSKILRRGIPRWMVSTTNPQERFPGSGQRSFGAPHRPPTTIRTSGPGIRPGVFGVRTRTTSEPVNFVPPRPTPQAPAFVQCSTCGAPSRPVGVACTFCGMIVSVPDPRPSYLLCSFEIPPNRAVIVHGVHQLTAPRPLKKVLR